MPDQFFVKYIALVGSVLMFLAVPPPWPLTLGIVGRNASPVRVVISRVSDPTYISSATFSAPAAARDDRQSMKPSCEPAEKNS